jgi:hypothetical protein
MQPAGLPWHTNTFLAGGLVAVVYAERFGGWWQAKPLPRIGHATCRAPCGPRHRTSLLWPSN